MDHKNFQRLNFACDNPVSIRPFRYEYSTHANYDQTYSYRDKRPRHKLRIVKWFCGLSLFFFFFPNSFIFRTNFLHLAWNIARINYAILLQILRSNFSTFQINLFFRHPSYVPLTSLLERPSRNIGSIMCFNSLYVFQYLQILFLIIPREIFKRFDRSFPHFSSILLDTVLNRYLVKYTACVIA